MRSLRKLSFLYCNHLTQLTKGAFSGMSNEHGVKISFIGTPIQRVHSGAFRHAHNIRELTIEGQDMTLSRHCFAAINQLDFLTLSGVALIEPQIFTNSSRFHVVNIHKSFFDIPPKAFENLAHVHQLIIQRSRIGSIASDAFTSLQTVEIIEIFDNHIGAIYARAFAGKFSKTL
ncbi:hypothetical protein WR25_25617 [Diploscapter pachys]|uniref:Receptor L-domain domain-containing protein n=1 Tax=Diploscapter pachys TaxID=2018661 RepID=A0A2A2LLB0_9BILA|nr:hypothetical protein WR25_25617 [Diploscapter pachys]